LAGVAGGPSRLCAAPSEAKLREANDRYNYGIWPFNLGGMLFKRRTTGELVVKPRLSSRTKLLLAGGTVTAVILAGSWIYNYGLSTAGFERLSAVQEQDRLKEEIRRRTAENAELREQLAQAQRSVQMNDTAFQELDRALKNSAQEIVKLREELNFYRNIISPADKKSGLRIQNLLIEPTGTANQYRYKLVLIQALKHEHTINGSASFEITGTAGGQDSTISIPGANERAIKVNFKYFQDIEGQFELPKNFKPRRIKVNVAPTGGAQPVEETYAWPQA
jgi:hypothetical protein